jgi:hypothetical protein
VVVLGVVGDTVVVGAVVATVAVVVVPAGAQEASKAMARMTRNEAAQYLLIKISPLSIYLSSWFGVILHIVEAPPRHGTTQMPMTISMPRIARRIANVNHDTIV